MSKWLLERAPIWRRSILLGLVVGVPLFFLRMVRDPFNAPKLGLLFAGVGIVVALRAAELLQRPRFEGLRLLLVPAGCLAIPLFVGWLFSDYKGWSVFGLYGRWQGLLPYLVVILLGILVADAFQGNVRTLAWAIVSAGAVVGGYAILQVIGADPFQWATAGENVNAALSTLGNPNFTGGFLSIVLPIAVGLWIVEPKNRRRSTQLLVLIVIGWIVPTSQGGWAAGLAGTFMVLAFLIGPRFRYGKALGIAAAIGAALGMVVLVLLSLNSAIDFPGTTIRARGDWWIAALRMAKESLFFGHGPNVFAVEGVQYRTELDAVLTNYDFANDPHSVLMSFLVVAGIIGAAGYLGLIGWTAYKAREITPENLYAPIFLGAATAYFAQSIVSIDEISLRLACWSVLGGLAASLSATPEVVRSSARTKGKKRAPVAPLRAPIAVGVLGLLGLGAFWWGLQFLVSDGRVRQGELYYETGLYGPAETEFERALALRDEYQYRGIWGLAAGQAALAAQEEGTTVLETSRAAYSYLPEFPDIPRIVEQARVLTNAPSIDPEAAEGAAALYARALELDPLNPKLRIEYADLLVQLDRSDEALSVLEPASNGGDLYPDYWAELAFIHATLGNVEEAQAALDHALALDESLPRAIDAQEILSGQPPDD